MDIVVQKYGGTSVGSVERIKAVAQRIARTVQSGKQVIAVVSAMGHTTDELIDLAKRISPYPNPRELDMLMVTGEQVSVALVAMALQEAGLRAISLTASQVGIRTEPLYGRARIAEVRTDRIRRELMAGKVVVVAGFQGVTGTWEAEITTLGRGGSDTTATAIAAAFQLPECEIYTDTEGVYTTDPRLVANARKLEEIDY
ncbi:MAG: aspartate kinase, partial [Deinococcus sp.]|nr:aspartate kinase [Deinococcus sp.]